MAPAFSNAKDISGASGSFKASLTPLNFLQDVKLNRPIPIAISGTSYRTFTVNASVSNPVYIINGRDYFVLKETLAYSWVVGSNAILDSTGAETTLTNGTVGVWYFYVNVTKNYTTKAVTYTLIPSLTAPVFAEGPKEAGYWAHPGTSKAKAWSYVGFHLCNAATPTFLQAIKNGYEYLIPAQSATINTVVSVPTALDFQNIVPATSPKIAGYITSGVTKTQSIKVAAKVSATSVVSLGFMKFDKGGETVAVVWSFGPIHAGSAGSLALYAQQSSTSTATLSVTRIEDWV